MKHKLKKIIPILIVVSMILTIGTACRDNRPTAQNEIHQGVIDRAYELAESPALPDVTVEKKLRWLSWYEMDETGPTAELFKAKYGIPEENKGENVIDRIQVSYEDRYPQLNALIAAGDSPDLFQFEERNFPWGVTANQYAPIDDLIDFSGSEWDNTREVIELFEWQGKNYCAVTEIANSPALLYYRKSIALEAGLDDPYDLWIENRWDWSAFMEMCQRFSDPANDKYGVVGFYIDEAAILSTGLGLLTIEDGQLKSNKDSGRIERAMDMLTQLATNNFRFPYHEISNFQILPGPFRNGNVLFWNDGPWRYQQEIRAMRDADNWPDDELRIVPFPRDPSADQYYHRGKQDALMLVAGSENTNGFIAWTQSAVLAAQDDKMREQNRQKNQRDYGWTDFQLDTLDKIIAETVLIWDFKNGIGEDVSGATFNSPIENLSKPVITLGESFTGQRAENRGVIEVRIKDINSGMSVEEIPTHVIPTCECDPNDPEEFCDACAGGGGGGQMG
jgi:multiple sugar transport system substrate-binding protein